MVAVEDGVEHNLDMEQVGDQLKVQSLEDTGRWFFFVILYEVRLRSQKLEFGGHLSPHITLELLIAVLLETVGLRVSKEETLANRLHKGPLLLLGKYLEVVLLQNVADVH